MSEIMMIPSRILNRLALELAMRTGINATKPTYVCAQMTMRCNSMCLHCNIWKNTYQQQELSTVQWIEILNNLHHWLGKFPLVFTGGEALLRNDMILLLQHAASLGIRAELLTNGLAIDEELAKDVVSSGINQLTVSYDGITANTLDRFRGAEGFFARTMAALSAIVHYRDTLNHPVKVLLKTVISRNNLEELCAIAVFARDNGYAVRYQPIEENYNAETDPAWHLKSSLWVDDLPLLRTQIAQLKHMKQNGFPVDNSIFELDRYVSYFETPEKYMAEIKAHEVGRSGKPCISAVSSFVISANGDVRMCYKMEPMGNVASHTPQAIWENRKRCWLKRCGFR